MRTGLTRRASGSGSGINYANFYLTFVPLENSTFTFTQRGTGTLYYSIDGGAWTECQSGVATPTVQVGSEIRWKGNLSPLTSAETAADNGLGVFSATGDFDAKGNPLSLTNSDSFVGVREIPKSNYCFTSLFYGNTKLVNAENLSLCCVKTRQNCYNVMFARCTSLLTPPAIDAGDAVYQSFMSMFSGCTSLEYGPNLTSIKSFAQSAVRTMFNNCSSMRTINIIFPPSENMNTYTFYRTFRNCSNLELSPVLPAKTLKASCYYQMFYGCSKINRITCLATDISASNCTNGWVDGVAATGTFVKAEAMTSWTTGNSGIPTNWLVEDAEKYDDEYLMFIPLEDATFTFTKRGTGDDIQYKIDDGEWTTLASGVASPTVQTGHKIRWRGTIIQKTDGSGAENGIGTFSASGNFDAKGNPLSMLLGDEFVDVTNLGSRFSYAFAYLFNGNTKLIHSRKLSLPMSFLNAYSYTRMFQGCTAMVDAPDLPANRLSSYSYAYMFKDCSSLATAPKINGDASLGTRCFNEMFENCTSLTTAPDLPYPTLSNACFYRMFKGCSSLNYIKCLATDISAINCTSGWVEGVAATGTFVKAATMTDWTTGTNGIPSGWTVVDAT